MIIVVTGGAASGKSELAERIICKLANGQSKLYIAAMETEGEEAQRRIRRHRELRAGKGFETLEYSKHFDKINISKEYFGVLFECMSNALANEMFSPMGAGKQWKKSIIEGIHIVSKSCQHLVIVTNDIFADGVEYDTFTMEYMQHLGELNQYFAQIADVVIESVYGIPVFRKGDFTL